VLYIGQYTNNYVGLVHLASYTRRGVLLSELPLHSSFRHFLSKPLQNGHLVKAGNFFGTIGVRFSQVSLYVMCENEVLGLNKKEKIH
jgi:hypothetical protein